MTAPELIANLRAMNAISADPRELFLYLAAHVHQCRLADGQRLNDLTDFEAWLIELAQAAKPPQNGCAQQAQRAQMDVDRQGPFHLGHAVLNTCPHCGHVHQGEKECGEPVGGGRVCRCE